jgi:hypothetical protein
MRKGRQKGQTKAKSIINDPLIAPYTITVEEDQYVLLDSKNIPQGYYSSLDSVINKVSKNVIANKKTTYTLSEYIKDYGQIKNQLTNVTS